jgi:predicted MPP superfamily phosphohydrolase
VEQVSNLPRTNADQSRLGNLLHNELSQMKRVAWLTDLHLNFLAAEERVRFLRHVQEEHPDAVLISGDIGEARDVLHFLSQIEAAWSCPIYFVLGNHDFYFGSIAEVRQRVANLCDDHPRLKYLTQCGVEQLTQSIGLVGHDGWADARLGDYERSLVMLNDYALIAELAGYSKQSRLSVLQAMGQEAAENVREKLQAAAERYRQVFLVTHVPPFREACWHEGRTSDDEWLPHFSCHAVGEAILEVMRSRPDCLLTVLCGHTHGTGETSPLPNVRVFTGGAVYGAPEIQRVFEVGT